MARPLHGLLSAGVRQRRSEHGEWRTLCISRTNSSPHWAQNQDDRESGRVYDVDGTVGSIDHLLGYRAQQTAPDGTVSMAAHEDLICVQTLRLTDDDLRRVTFQDP